MDFKVLVPATEAVVQIARLSSELISLEIYLTSPCTRDDSLYIRNIDDSFVAWTSAAVPGVPRQLCTYIYTSSPSSTKLPVKASMLISPHKWIENYLSTFILGSLIAVVVDFSLLLFPVLAFAVFAFQG